MQLFYAKGRCNNVIDHVSIEPIVQSRQLQWPILLVRWYNHSAITCKCESQQQYL